VDRRIGDHVLVALRTERRGREERREVDFEACGRVQIPLAADQRMDLAEPARVLARNDHPPGSPGMKEWLVAGRHLELHLELAGERLEHALDREEIGARRLAAPIPRPDGPRREAGDPPGLMGGSGTVPGELAGEDALMRRAALPEVGAPRLGQRYPLCAAGAVVTGCVEQRAEDQRPHHRMLGGQRVRDPDRLRPEVLLCDSQSAGHPGIGEAESDDHVEAEVSHHVFGPPAQRLLAGETPGLPACGRQGRLQVGCVAVEAADLLDQVDLAGDVVVAMDRDRDLQPLPSA
jgi:hypothetical protein